nr:unnamed protein product [Spirometra erinaceieuropaei]
MRWKGTVIKPLAEISASETTTLQQPQPLQHSGNRRASVSTFSPTTKSPSCGSGSGHHQLDAVGNNDCDAGLPLHTGSRQNGGGGVDAYCPPRILSRVLPSGGLEFVCPVCDLSCEQSPAALRVHFARAHLDLDAYVCPHCRSSTFSDLHAIRTHLQDEHPESAWCSTEDLLSETFRAAVAGVVIEESSAEAIRQPKSPKYVSNEDLELGRYCCESPPPPPASSSGGEVQSLRDREEASSSCRSSGLFTTIFAAYEDIQEGQLVVHFLLHRKLNVREDGVEMFLECQHLIPFDDDEGVIYMPGPEFRSVVLEDQRL